ncbi:hypothetical protein [Agaribacter marinus]|uniref:hypothetical protein n=1 Tax=Agaribacter marinus TaxID=1431249 RepID=UPI0024E0E4BA|nr:hypothetical protein [Agaribacter marinus]
MIIWLLQTNWVQQLFSSTQTTISAWVTGVLTVPDRQKIASLRDAFMRNNMSLQSHQTDYVFEVTDTIQGIQRFHRLYCAGDDKNPYLFGRNLDKFCQEITSSGILPIGAR